MSREATEQLKALGSLAVIFFHVSYFLLFNDSFLYPFSNYGGVAVNIFFFLSAIGLVLSYSKWQGNIKGYFKQRFLRIVPLIWLTLTLFFILDFFVLGKYYGTGYMLQHFLLFFQSSDLYSDVNSPLWYITPLVLYYLTFPFLYKKTKPLVSAFIFLVFGYVIAMLPISNHLMEIHYFAFPIGILWSHYSEHIVNFIKNLPHIGGILVMALLLSVVLYTGIYSGVGGPYEQYISSITMVSVALFLMLLPVAIPGALFVGSYSFELYLLHWPLMYRYDFLYDLRSTPYVWLGAWFIVLFFISHLFRVCSSYLTKKVTSFSS